MHDPMLAAYPGASTLVRVAVAACFLNCARYIHEHVRVSESPYVPDAVGCQAFPSWKRIDMLQEVLPTKDMRRTDAEGGEITFEEYVGKVMDQSS